MRVDIIIYLKSELNYNKFKNWHEFESVLVVVQPIHRSKLLREAGAESQGRLPAALAACAHFHGLHDRPQILRQVLPAEPASQRVQLRQPHSGVARAQHQRLRLR